MTTWASDFCDANGVRLHYLRTGGRKPPLVMLHGLMGSGATWVPLARALEGAYDVVMPDARGHGKSSTPAHGYGYEDHASDVAGLIRALGLDSPVLLGHSMGGMTAAVVAARNGGLVRALVLVDPTFLSPERQREVHQSGVVEQHRRLLSLGSAALLADLRARHPHRPAEILERLAEAREQVRLEAFEVLTPPNPGHRELLRALEVPCLLVIGDNAPVVSLEAATELQQLNPRVRVEQVSGAGHGLPFDQPERLGALVNAMVARPR